MIGETILHYRIDARIGQGGMGVVYRATDLKLLRTVALKFIPADVTADHDANERFLREARAASALDHVNVGTIFGVELAPDGRQFIAMAYYEGETIARTIARGPLPVERADDLLRQIAAGLGEAHARGVVHRDIKPSNVILTRQRIAKIVDFGLASLGGSARLTLSGTRSGTPQYMSPEQAMGERVDHRSDLWSLGVMLYEMLTGRAAFDAPSIPAVLYRVVHEDLSLDGVDGVHRAVIARALAKNPADRFQSAGQMVAALDGVELEPAVASDSAVTALQVPASGARSARRAPTGAPRRPQWIYKRPLTLAAGGLLLVAALWAGVSLRPGPGAAPHAVAGGASAFDAYLPALDLLDRWEKDDNLSRAIGLLETSVERDPSFALGYARLAEAHRLQAAVSRDPTKLQVARQYAEDAARLGGDLPAVKAALGKVYLALNQNDLALTTLQQALTLDARHGETHVALGRLYEKLGRLDEAQAAYERGVALQPDAWQHLYAFGSFHFRQGRYAEAIELWQRVTALTPDNGPALINLGAALLETGRLDEAQSAFRQALAIKPNYTASMNLGKIAFLQGRFADAAEMFAAAAEMNPEDYVPVGNLAAAYWWVPGRKADASRTFRHAAQLAEASAKAAPTDATVFADLSIYYAKVAEPELARRRLDTALALDAEGAAVQATAGETLEILGDRRGAVRHIRRAIALGYRREELQRNPELRRLLADPAVAGDLSRDRQGR